MQTTSLYKFTEKKYAPIYERYRAGGLQNYMMLVDTHWQCVREAVLHKVESRNKKFFRNLQAFRTYLDEEISRMGDEADLNKRLQRAIILNKNCRDRESEVGHHYITEDNYHFGSEDGRDLRNDLWTKEWQMCSSHVIGPRDDHDPLIGVTWYILSIPKYIYLTRESFPNLQSFITVNGSNTINIAREAIEEAQIESEDAEKYIKELVGYLESENRVRQGQAELELRREMLEQEGKWLRDRYTECDNERGKLRVEIWDRKNQLIAMRKKRLQCDRIEKENKEYVKGQSSNSED